MREILRRNVRNIRTKQAAPVAAEGQGGIKWYQAEDGGLVNLDLAQQIQVYEIDGVVSIIASYNDGSENVLRSFGNDEDAAFAELDVIAGIVGAQSVGAA